jgi:hypothetical protein
MDSCISPIANTIVAKIPSLSLHFDEPLAEAMSKAHNKGKAGTGREQREKGDKGQAEE